MDDDTYLNVAELVEVLGRYNHTLDWYYLGKPSLKKPMVVSDRSNPGQKPEFWFATVWCWILYKPIISYENVSLCR